MLMPEVSEDIVKAFEAKCRVFEVRLISDCKAVIIAEDGIHRGNLTITGRMLEECLLYLTGHSYHSFQREISQGYIPVKNGHRAGLAGTYIYSDSGKITGLKNITSIILRIANEAELKENPLIEYISKKGLNSLLVSGPPCSGKTALLRDTAKKLSQMGFNTVVADEKQELFAHLTGCSIIKGAEKADGIRIAVKNLSPQVIICDEVSGIKEAEAIAGALNSGVSVLASLHSKDYADFKNKRVAQMLTSTKEFKKAFFLSSYPCVGKLKETADLT